jgi:hypothetical protein
MGFLRCEERYEALSLTRRVVRLQSLVRRLTARFVVSPGGQAFVPALVSTKLKTPAVRLVWR